jgi:hypothetical protein
VTASVHNLSVRVAVVITASWLFALIALHIGLPRVARSDEIAQRPMESLGVLALCLPAGMHAGLLVHGAGWLTQLRSRRHLLRSLWFLVVASAGGAAAITVATLAPSGVPESHVVALWLLWFALASLGCAVARPGLAAAAPLAVSVLSTIPAVMPFERNPIYNLAHQGELRHAVLATTVGAVVVHVRWGDSAGRT